MKKVRKLIFLFLLLGSAAFCSAATLTFNIIDKTGYSLSPIPRFQGADNCVTSSEKIECIADESGVLTQNLMFLSGKLMGASVGPELGISNQPIFMGQNFLLQSFSFRTGKIFAKISQTQWDGKSDVTVNIEFTLETYSDSKKFEFYYIDE